MMLTQRMIDQQCRDAYGMIQMDWLLALMDLLKIPPEERWPWYGQLIYNRQYDIRRKFPDITED